MRLWLLQKQGYASYFASCAVLIKGPVNVFELQRAIEDTVNRNEILRTSFPRGLAENQVLQLISPACRIEFCREDLSGLPSKEQDARIDNLRLTQKFEINENVLYAYYLSLDKEKHVLVLFVPSLCADKHSLILLVQKVVHAYGQLRGGSAFSEEVLQYADIAEYLNKVLESEESHLGRRYWRDLGPDNCTGWTVTVGASGKEFRLFAPKVLRERVSPELVKALRRLATGSGMGLEDILLAAWRIVLWRLSGQENLVICTYFNRRTQVPLEACLGLFGEFLPTNCPANGRLIFLDVLERVCRARGEGAVWQDCYWSGIDENGAVWSFDYCLNFMKLLQDFSVEMLFFHCCGVTSLPIATK